MCDRERIWSRRPEWVPRQYLWLGHVGTLEALWEISR
jgi:hypothetical protein